MRDLAHALPRYTAARIVAGEPYREEGRGLGFSIGGFHPFRINDWKSAVKKVDSNVTKALGINKIPIIGDLHKAVTGAVDRLDNSINKDFQKTKTWAQDHRKQLQIAAAIAGAAVGGWYLYSAASGAGAAGAAAAGEAGTGVTTSAILTAPAIEALPAASAALPASLLAPATVGAGEALATVGGTVAAASGGSSILSTIGSVLGAAAKEAAPLLALGKALGVVGSQQQPAGIVDMGGGPFYGGAGGFSGGGGGGGFLGPSDLGMGQDQTAQKPGGIPGWAWIAGGGLLLYFMTE